MIRKFNEKDLHAVMELWLESNIEAHDFIDSRYWKENYSKCCRRLRYMSMKRQRK